MPRWYKDAKFGIFVHWGVYSVPGGRDGRSAAEWYLWYQSIKDTAEWKYHRDTYGEDFTYDDFIPQFKAEKYDPGRLGEAVRAGGRRVLRADQQAPRRIRPLSRAR